MGRPCYSIIQDKAAFKVLALEVHHLTTPGKIAYKLPTSDFNYHISLDKSVLETSAYYCAAGSWVIALFVVCVSRSALALTHARQGMKLTFNLHSFNLVCQERLKLAANGN